MLGESFARPPGWDLERVKGDARRDVRWSRYNSYLGFNTFKIKPAHCSIFIKGKSPFHCLCLNKMTRYLLHTWAFAKASENGPTVPFNIKNWSVEDRAGECVVLDYPPPSLL